MRRQLISISKLAVFGLVPLSLLMAQPQLLGADEMPIFGDMTGLSCKGSSDSAFPGFAVSSFSLGDSLPAGSAASGTGAGAGKPSFQDISVVKGLDDCTPLMFEAVAKGTHFSSITLTVVHKGNKTPILVIQLTDATVTSDKFTEGAAKELDEVITLSYTKIMITHVPSGNKVTIDVLTNTAQ